MCGNYILSSLVSSFFISVFSSFLLTLSGALSEYKRLPPGMLFFPSFCFLMEMTATQNLPCPFAGLSMAVRGLPEGRRMSRQDQTALANLDLTLRGRGSLHLMSHEVTKYTLPLLCHSQRGKVYFITVSYT